MKRSKASQIWLYVLMPFTLLVLLLGVVFPSAFPVLFLLTFVMIGIALRGLRTFGEQLDKEIDEEYSAPLSDI